METKKQKIQHQSPERRNSETNVTKEKLEQRDFFLLLCPNYGGQGKKDVPKYHLIDKGNLIIDGILKSV